MSVKSPLRLVKWSLYARLAKCEIFGSFNSANDTVVVVRLPNVKSPFLQINSTGLKCLQLKITPHPRSRPVRTRRSFTQILCFPPDAKNAVAPPTNRRFVR